MFPKNKAEDFFEMSISDARDALSTHTAQAVSFMYGSQHWDKEERESSMYLRRICYRITMTLNQSPLHAAFGFSTNQAHVLMRLFPYTRYMLQCFGEDSIPIFMDCLSVYATGCSYVEDERHHKLMASQIDRMFGQQDQFYRGDVRVSDRFRCGPPVINQISKPLSCPQCDVIGNSHSCHDNYHIQYK